MQALCDFRVDLWCLGGKGTPRTDRRMSRWVTSDRAFGPPGRADVRYTSNSDQTVKCREGPISDMKLSTSRALVLGVYERLTLRAACT